MWWIVVNLNFWRGAGYQDVNGVCSTHLVIICVLDHEWYGRILPRGAVIIWTVGKGGNDFMKRKMWADV